MINKELIKDCIYTNPIALLAFKDKENIDFINSFLPYSTGFEIECNLLKEYNFKNFESIPYLMDYNKNNIDIEQRFRIPNGLTGIICLYNICNELPKNCSLNEGSGIHYHVDCTDIFTKIYNQNFITNNNNWIIDELIKWNTAKKINNSAVVSFSRAWVRIAEEHKTIEFRIGEMSFNYEILINRILDCNRIVKQIKLDILNNEIIKYQSLDVKSILDYLKLNSKSGQQKILESYKQQLVKSKIEYNNLINPIDIQVDKDRIVKSRIKKFI